MTWITNMKTRRTGVTSPHRRALDRPNPCFSLLSHWCSSSSSPLMSMSMWSLASWNLYNWWRAKDCNICPICQLYILRRKTIITEQVLIIICIYFNHPPFEKHGHLKKYPYRLTFWVPSHTAPNPVSHWLSQLQEPQCSSKQFFCGTNLGEEPRHQDLWNLTVQWCWMLIELIKCGAPQFCEFGTLR